MYVANLLSHARVAAMGSLIHGLFFSRPWEPLWLQSVISVRDGAKRRTPMNKQIQT
jgi:hypothetical protein